MYTIVDLKELVAESNGIMIVGKIKTGKTVMLRRLKESIPYDKKITTLESEPEVSNSQLNILPNEVVVNFEELKHNGNKVDTIKNHQPDYVILDYIKSKDEMSLIHSIAKSGIKIIAAKNGDSALQSVYDSAAFLQEKYEVNQGSAFKLLEQTFNTVITLTSKENDRYFISEVVKFHSINEDDKDIHFEGLINEPLEISSLIVDSLSLRI